ncbi:MAG: DUF354 domain-containing protein [Ignavibacteria bacterium]|nr:DUF354 domain-containing protein [Ignavibacteria bacterium]
MIWFDLDNSPHVPLFIPILNELKKRNEEFEVSARDFAQTLGLLELWNVQHTTIGTHGGKSKAGKVFNLLKRSQELKKFAAGNNFTLAVSHGSRTQLVAAAGLKIPSLLMLDYEYTETRIFNRYANYLLIPKFIPDERLRSVGLDLKKVIRYNGFKEELYMNAFVPEPDFRSKIGSGDDKTLILIRPPGMLGNYHNKKSEKLLVECMYHFSSFENTDILITSRSAKDKKFIEKHAAGKNNIRFLQSPVDGLQLVYSADIVISGGGTMNRESALAGTNTYSIFTGKKPYLDEYLEQMGRLKFISSVEDIKQITPQKELNKDSYVFNKHITEEVTDIILNISISKNG